MDINLKNTLKAVADGLKTYMSGKFLDKANNLSDVSNRQTALNTLLGASQSNAGNIPYIDSTGNAILTNRYETGAGMVANEVSIHDHRNSLTGPAGDVYVPMMYFIHRNSMDKFELEFSVFSVDNQSLPTYYGRYVFNRSNVVGMKFYCLDWVCSDKTQMDYDDILAVDSGSITHDGSQYNTTTIYRKRSNTPDFAAYCIHSMSTYSFDWSKGYVIPTYYTGKYDNVPLKDGERVLLVSDLKSLSDLTNPVAPIRQSTQPDWNQNDSTAADYIKNKPTLIQNLVDGSATGSLRSVGSATEDNSYTMGTNAFAEGSGTKASGFSSHAEGNSTTADGTMSHAEGSGTTASGTLAHAEGGGTTASGTTSHAEGNSTTASGDSSHAEGEFTIANHLSQHVFGEYNEVDTSSAAASARGTYVEIVGNGTNTSRSNARTLDWEGNEVLAGGLTTGGYINNNDMTQDAPDTLRINVMKVLDVGTQGNSVTIHIPDGYVGYVQTDNTPGCFKACAWVNGYDMWFSSYSANVKGSCTGFTSYNAGDVYGYAELDTNYSNTIVMGSGAPDQYRTNIELHISQSVGNTTYVPYCLKGGTDITFEVESTTFPATFVTDNGGVLTPKILIWGTVMCVKRDMQLPS